MSQAMTHAEHRRCQYVRRRLGGHRSAALSTSPLAARPFAFVLVKLASRCNIKCTYCYWFRDAMVYAKPAVLTPEAEDAFCLRLEEHIREFDLPFFLLVFHGGEPLLFPKRRFDAFLKKLRAIEAAHRLRHQARRHHQRHPGRRRMDRAVQGRTTSTSPSASMGRPRSTTSSASTSKAAARWRKRWKGWRCCARPDWSRG